MTDPTVLLSVRNIETWYGAVNAIKGVSLEVAEGRIVAVLGANGAGKSTLLRTIAGVNEPFKGSIHYDGWPIHGHEPDRVARAGIVLVPEGRQVFPFLSVEDNLRMGTFARRDAAGAAADLERIYGWFPRLKERRGQHGGLLSGGEQQMLAIGRALMARPRLLLLDEPSLGLAPLLVREIFRTILEINRGGVTVLLVEQNAHMALSIAGRGYVLETGRVQLEDQAARLLQNEDVKKAYLGG
jgi:branched-chain amino acid transport system ATP-binding protein